MLGSTSPHTQSWNCSASFLRLWKMHLYKLGSVMKLSCWTPPLVGDGIIHHPFGESLAFTLFVCKSRILHTSARQNKGSPLPATEVRICPNWAFSKVLIAFIVLLLWKITGNEETASPFPLQYTSKAGFPLQISTGVRCRYVFRWGIKIPPTVIVCGFPPPLSMYCTAKVRQIHEPCK